MSQHMVSVSDVHILKTLKVSLARLRPFPSRTRFPFEGLPRNLIRVQPNELLTTYKLFHLKSCNTFGQYHHLKLESKVLSRHTDIGLLSVG